MLLMVVKATHRILDRHGLTDIEQSEDLISTDLVGIPNLAIVQYQAATTFMIFLFENVQHFSLSERLLLVFKLQSTNELFVIATKLGDATKLLCGCDIFCLSVSLLC